jgi:hypothetical protein
MRKKQKKFLTLLCCTAFPANICLLVFADSYREQGDMLFFIAHFVARKKGYKVEGQTGVTGTYLTQCHHDGKVLSL